jgi:riboflavin synthase
MPTKVGIHDLPFARCKVVDADLRRHDGGTVLTRLTMRGIAASLRSSQ